MRLKNYNFFNVPFKQNGFTMIEVMVVTSIIGILSVAAVTSYFTMRPTNNMHSFGRDLIAAAQGARLEAVKRNVCVGITLNFAAAPPVNLTGVANRGSYIIFLDDNCNALQDAGEIAITPNPVLVPEGVALTQSGVAPIVYIPGPPEAGDPNFRAAGTDLFDSISFNPRSLVAATTFTGQAIVLRNDPNPANATWWGRVVVNNLGGSMAYQTNNNPANQSNWSE